MISQGPDYFVNVSGFSLLFVCGGVFVLGSSLSGAPSGELKFNFLLYFQLGPAGVVVVIVAGCSSDGVLVTPSCGVATTTSCEG